MLYFLKMNKLNVAMYLNIIDKLNILHLRGYIYILSLFLLVKKTFNVKCNNGI